MIRLQRIDETHLGAHHYLNANDECYFVHEYTSGVGFSYGDTNSFVSNLKKSPLRAGRPEYRYKGKAIERAISTFSTTINEEWLRTAILVPVPPSKAVGDPEYDDRMLQICQGIRVGQTQARVCKIVEQTESRGAAYVSDLRPTPDELVKVYRINESECPPGEGPIGIVDDVLTAGTHFRAMHTVLSGRFPRSSIVGFFLARRIFPETEQVDLSHLFKGSAGKQDI